MAAQQEPFPWKKLIFKTSFTIGLLLLEQVAFLLAIWIIYNQRFMHESLRHYLYCLPAIVISSVILIDFFKLSYFQRKPIQTAMYDSFKFVVLFIAIVCIYAYVLNLYALSRYVLVLGGAFCYILITIWVELCKRIGWRFYEKGHLLIIAKDDVDADGILAKIQYEVKGLHLDIVGWMTPDRMNSDSAAFQECSEVLISNNIDEKDKSEILILCSDNNKAVYIVPTFYDLTFSRYRIVKFYDTPSFFIENTGLTFQQLLLKRVFDIVFSAIVLVLTSPLYLLIALLIKLDSKGPVFYTQERVTNNGKVYKVIKFRTMVANAEKLFGAYQSLGDDPRVTKVGKFLRNTHLDELPQFFNVLQGSMSVVGPRSDRAITLDLLEKQAVGYNYRLKVKSGITGLAQLFGKYNSDPADKLRYDIYYIKNYSLIMDVLIILLTVGAMLPKADNINEVKTSSDYFIHNDNA